MSSKKSLRWRFCVTLILPILLMLLAVGIAAYYSAHEEIDEVYDAQLAHTAKIMLGLMKHEVEEGEADMKAIQERFSQIGHSYEKHTAVRVWKDDRLFYASENASAFGPQHVIAGFSTKYIDGQHWRFFVMPDPESGMISEAAENTLIREDIIGKILVSMFAPALALLLVIPFLTWIGLKSGLRPLEQLSHQVSARTPDDLNAISEERTPREILPLTQAINRLLGKLKTALYKERRFTDLAAHELKTPLAVIKTLSQSAQRARNEEERSQLLADLNDATDRATAMMMQLLSLARLDHESLVREPVILNDLIREVRNELAPLAQSKGVSIEVEADEQTTIQGNRDMLLLALRNLLDNAIKYTPAEGRIDIRLRSQDNRTQLTIADSGPGVSESELGLLTERFYRIPGNRQPGSGLGLTIVSRIAELLGIGFTLSNAQPHGLIAELTF